jgi:hypothetical protein
MRERLNSDREVMEDAGYDVEHTPIDVLMSREGLGFSVAYAMEYDDEIGD